ncbi:Phosphatidylethanolamine-binding protein PEBP [Kalmanozyma brasiliensis GHG001]|uniref:Phosphatidylethanolamine-binding protein PEBP n=1 Tax=Kalmanozyma brasiliensis (strain GHG001) TaxID=1365824 RepID=UPI00286835F6|nr:Phosphatidylethanolamine-binding protein PEBP [Kalmanozyma brasiliensis GHG001]KAF6766765.1 Phosphatidylethanolamine-binding protein PEBP [Kalmanozyma brasiliensis GHG001]
MDGKRCSRVSTSSGSTRQKAKYKPSKTTPAVQSKANFSLPPATTTRSGRSQKIAQHAPVLLCPPPMRSRKNKTKATTKLTIKVPRKTNTSTPAAPSSDAALPGDEEDHLTSASSDEATGGQGSSSSAVTPTAALQSSPRSIEEIAEAVTRPSLGVTAQPTQIVAQPSRSSTAQEGGGQNDPNKTTSVSMETADAPSKSTPNPQLEKFTVGLVKDIEASIKSCQDRIASSPDQVGLMALSVTSSVLIKDIDKALTSYDSALDSANPRHFILPKLKENLEQIQEGCERARDAFKDEKMDANERLARQLEPVLMSDVVFGRCLTLISMHVEEESA